MAQELPQWVIGATTIGLICKDGVILASEKRVSLGHLVMSKAGKKVFRITDRVGAVCAGLTSDFQILVRTMVAQANLYALEMNRGIPVKAVAKLMSNVLFSRRMLPLITQTIVAGVDEEGARLYALDLLGSLVPDQYAAVGSGARVAIGVLEAGYKPDMTVKEGRALAIKAIKSASERDVASGEGIDVLTITPKGVEDHFESLK